MKKLNGGPLGDFKNFPKKLRFLNSMVPKKNLSKKHQRRDPSYVFEVLDVDVFVLDEVPGMFWTSVVQVDVVEQMNKKSGPYASKKLPTVTAVIGRLTR